MDAARLARLRIDGNFAYDCAGAQRQIACVHGWVNQARRRVKGRVNIASALALASAASITAAAIFIVFQAVGGNTSAILRQNPPHLLYALLERYLCAVQFRGPLKNAVGKVWKIFLYPCDAQVQIYFVVVRRDVAVADRPILTESVAVFGFEVVVGQAQREPPPDVGFASQAACAHPGIVRAGVRILALVNDNIFHIIAVSNIAFQMLRFFKAWTVGRPTDGVLIKRNGMRVWRKGAAMRIIVEP